MANGSSAPATKEDVGMIMELLVRNELNIERVEREMQLRFDETKRHFDVVAENIKHDMLHGALHDKVAQHEDRIRVLERRKY
jgi:hypothetical protein